MVNAAVLTFITWAEHLLDKHLPLGYVSKQLRNKSISTTMADLDVNAADINK